MLNDISPFELAGVWCTTIVLITVCGMVAAVALTTSGFELLLAICFVPPSVMFLLWRGAPPVTHGVNSPSKESQL